MEGSRVTEQEYCTIIGIKEVEIYNLTKLNQVIMKELEAVKAQLHKERGDDGNHPV